MVNVNVKDTSSISNNDGDDVDLHVLFRIKEYQMITVEIPQYNSNNTNTNGLNHQRRTPYRSFDGTIPKSCGVYRSGFDETSIIAGLTIVESIPRITKCSAAAAAA